MPYIPLSATTTTLRSLHTLRTRLSRSMVTSLDPSMSQTAAGAAAAAAATILPTLPPSRDIPSTFFSSVKSWWASGEKEGALSEERLLRRLPFFRPAGSPPITPAEGPLYATSTQVRLGNTKEHLNMLSITSTSPAPDAPPPAVLLHGYGAGLGFFFQNFPSLGRWAAKRGSSVYALDWLGMGRSARVPFTVRAARDDTVGRVAEAESFFVDSLERWREQMGLEKMTLVGHSLGGYLSVAYALRHPNRVSRLILLSPAGVPRDPNATTVPSREFVESQEDAVDGPDHHGSHVKGGAHAELATKGNVEKVRQEQKVQKRQESRTRRLFTYLWEEGYSPFQVVRAASIFAPMMVGKYSSRRFSGLSVEETRDMHNYIQQITLAKGSGEYCISHILAPGAHARLPLVDRVAALKIPITFVYGEHDWMDPQGGYDAVENMRKAGNGGGKMYIVPAAGHHLYLDNSKAVDELLTKELDRTIERRQYTAPHVSPGL